VTIELTDVNTPIGLVWLAFNQGNLCAAKFEGGREHVLQVVGRRFGSDVSTRRLGSDNVAASALRAYFAGELDALSTVPVDAGGTAFQRRVWHELRTIPPGSTLSYSQIAARIGVPSACRAVARANATNPTAIVIPCHRVIGRGGELRGYGGGIERKAWLLSHEGAHPQTGAELRP